MSAVVQTVELGMQWPTLDPFLFCVHHVDHYPAANDRQGPAASLVGRTLGQDFEGVDGWRMYHGQVVPGFPAHPHRGFETVTYVRQGLIDHADSLGAAARYGRGDVQWLTAGSGIQNAEMYPLLDRDGPNPAELYQNGLNLPPADKLVEPHIARFWDSDVPRVFAEGVTVTSVAGTLGDTAPPTPPPASWASRAEADVAIWHLVIEPGASWTIPAAASADANRVLYVFEGADVDVDGTTVTAPTGVVVDPTAEVPLQVAADASGPTEILMLQGRPLDEPVAQYGPFVMNTRAEIQQAFEDYQRTRFGGWPWDRDDPVHGLDEARFARHADGRVDAPA
jgi:redox-sensitive bicupin YhaK (pirin superfamily)